MQKPLVSILIPAYNAERFIKDALDSAFAQTYPEIEVVVVNDGSKDKTEGIIKSYRDPRLRYFYQENKGITRTRNRLLREAKGEFIAFLDSDDVYLPDKTRKEAEFLINHPEYAAVYCGLSYFFDGEPNKFYHHRYKFPEGDIFEELLKKQFITNTTLMLRQSVIEKIGYFDESTREVEDWAYFLKMARLGMKFGFISEDLVRFRLRWDNNTRFEKQALIQADAVDIFERLNKELSPEERKRHKVKRKILIHRLKSCLAYLGLGKKKEAYAVLNQAFSSRILKFFLIILFSPAYLIPNSFLKFVMEKIWNFKKKNLFIPIS